MRFWGACVPAVLPGALACMLAAAFLPAGAEARFLTVTHQRIEGWRLDVARDRFTGDLSCRLNRRRPGVSYFADVLAFDVGRRQNALAATIRLDAGAPIAWRDMFPELARMDVTVSGRDLATPSDGLVLVPLATVGEAGAVWIQAGFGARPRMFSLSGFGRAHAAALALGCTPDRFRR